jgi:RNA ligase
MKYDLSILNDYIDRGLVIKQDHPSLPLSIYNYSRECQYSKQWDDITLTCRGLILDNEGNVVAKPFPKFFNYEEHKPEEIPNESFRVYEKLDGSLGIVFHYENKWHVATRGSFVSGQAIKGKELLEKYPLDKLDKNNTYLAEILFKENRIVIDYGDYEGLVLLGAYNRNTGVEIGRTELEKLDGWDIVTTYKTWGEDWETLKKEISNDNEGYVIRFSGGMRMKIKGEEYVRLHRILTNFSTKDIWELLRNNEQLEPFLERVPDEFDDWVKRIMMNLKWGFYHIDERAGKLHDGFRYGKYNDRDPEPTKKEFAEFVMKQPEELRPILFKMWDKAPYDDIIWKLLKPKYEKPFKTETN